MTLKFSDRPQVHYGNQSASDMWRSRFPSDAMPISQAPPHQAIFGYEANGFGDWLHYRRGAYRRLAPQKDFRSGAITWREDGTRMNPVMFTLPRKK